MADVGAVELPSRSDDIAELIASHERAEPGFWDFTTAARRGGHAFFQYPAMMVPELQGTLLDDLLAVDPAVSTVYDPFMGSGTVLLESIYRGLSFHGVDINPLAVLLSHVKAAPPAEAKAKRAVDDVVSAARRSRSADFDFPNITKWFQPTVRTDLSKLRSAIRRTEDVELRRFLWICLAETIRLVSNSRTSTVKLHAYSAEQLRERRPQAISTFETVGRANAKRCAAHWEAIALRTTDRARPKVTLQRSSILSEIVGPVKADAIMTSPPYGDNDTTVPYGQHSYLPLRWIDPKDLVGNLEPELLRSTGRIDTLSLGGSLVGALAAQKEIEAKSTALADLIATISARGDLVKKVVAFASDYERALARACQPLRAGGFAFWTLGERRVGGSPVPLVQMTRDFLALHGHEPVQHITRLLPKRRRMAGANSLGQTMSVEHVLVTVNAR